MGCKDAKYGLLPVATLPDKKAATVQKALQEGLVKLRRRCGEGAPYVVRFHCNVDPSFEKETRAWIRGNEWEHRGVYRGYDNNRCAG